MNTLPERLRAEATQLSWNRSAAILTEAANKIDNLQEQIKDNAIMHVREIDELRKAME